MMYILYRSLSYINKLYIGYFYKNKNKKMSIGDLFLKNSISFTLFICTILIYLNILTYVSHLIIGLGRNDFYRIYFAFQLFLIILGGGLTVINNMFNKKENMTNSKHKQKTAKKQNNKKQNNKSSTLLIILYSFVFIIPIMSAIQLLTTIITRGINGIISSKYPHKPKLFFSATLIMILVIFIIEFFTGLNIDMKTKKA